MIKRIGFGALSLVILCMAPATPAPRKRAAVSRKPAAKPPAVATPRMAKMTADEARMTIELLDDAYQLLLDEVHHTYPTQPGRPVAASIMRDLQKRMGELGWPKSRFLAVNAIVMNPDHRAQDAFEEKVVLALRRGDQRVEQLEPGRLRVATPISLGGSCFSCHWTASGQASRAAIVWNVPVK